MRFLRIGEPPSVVVCLNTPMANDPQENVDVPADDELSDETLDDVSGGDVREIW